MDARSTWFSSSYKSICDFWIYFHTYRFLWNLPRSRAALVGSTNTTVSLQASPSARLAARVGQRGRRKSTTRTAPTSHWVPLRLRARLHSDSADEPLGSTVARQALGWWQGSGEGEGESHPDSAEEPSGST